MEHEHHFTVDEANALLGRIEPVLGQLRAAKARLTDEEAHSVLTDASATNGGGGEGRQVGEAFVEVRRLLSALQQAGIVVRDIDRGLIDFPSLRNGQEVYLCWELGEDEITHWHEIESGYGGRQPLE